MSLQNLPLDTKKLEELIKQARHYNIFPMYLPQYIQLQFRQHLISKLLVELVDDAYECLSACRHSEIEELWNAMPQGYRMSFEPKLELDTERQRRKFATYYISSVVERSYFSFKGALEQGLSNSEVIRIYPELAKKFGSSEFKVIRSTNEKGKLKV